MKAPFDKYDTYFRAVQAPESDIRFIVKRYREAFGRSPEVLGEDFCGTFALSCAWVKGGKNRRAVGVDYSSEPLVYGMKHFHGALAPGRKARVGIARADVRNPRLPKADVIAAMNFSYFIFKARADLKEYFRNVWHRLSPKGLFVLDCFGGWDCAEPSTDVTHYRKLGFTYYWEQFGFDPATNQAKFAIHFKRRGERVRRNVFTYDWRMWTLPELRELLTEVGFDQVDFFYDDDGTFRRWEHWENESAWLANIVARRGKGVRGR